jgi:mono/diheme cytochrome c family protein
MLNRRAQALTMAMFLLVLPSMAWTQTTVKKLQFRPTSSVDGKDVYQAYCAYCHGDDLRGRGPGSVGVRVPPPDLTTIALRNDGKFSAGNVAELINRWKQVPRTMADMVATQQAAATGEQNEYSQPMPAFGPIFAKLYPQEVRDRQVRMANVVGYIKSKQVKTPWPEDPK